MALSFVRILGSNSRTALRRWCRFSYSSASAAVAEAESTEVKDYADYRRSLYGQITHKALFVDAVGTLVLPSQPMAQVRHVFRFARHLKLKLKRIFFIQRGSDSVVSTALFVCNLVDL